MSRVFNGDTDFLSVADTVALGAYPLTLVAWVKRAAASGALEFIGGPVTIGDSNHRIGLVFTAANEAGALARAAGDQVATAGAVTNTNWHLLVGRFGGQNSRFAYLDGSVGTEDTASAGVNFTTMNDFRIGRSGSGATPLAFAGKVGYFAIFDYQLSQGDIDDLVSGAETPPTLATPATHFWDFSGSSLSDTGSVGGLTLTATGTTVDTADNPLAAGNASGAGATATASAPAATAEERLAYIHFTGSNNFIDESGAAVANQALTFYVWRAPRPPGSNSNGAPDQILLASTDVDGELSLEINPGSLNDGDRAFAHAFAPEGTNLFWLGEVAVHVVE